MLDGEGAAFQIFVEVFVEETEAVVFHDVIHRNFIFFEDYTADELMDILHKNLEKQEYVLSKAAEKKARKMIQERVANKPDNFANARDIRNFMEHAISNHACRVVNLENVDSDKGILSTLEVEDLEPFDSDHSVKEPS